LVVSLRVIVELMTGITVAVTACENDAPAANRCRRDVIKREQILGERMRMEPAFA
jgi:hypothetical protein